MTSTGTSTGIRLHAPAPGWSVTADVVVVGSGVAGLTAALRCDAAGLRTVVVTKVSASTTAPPAGPRAG